MIDPRSDGAFVIPKGDPRGSATIRYIDIQQMIDALAVPADHLDDLGHRHMKGRVENVREDLLRLIPADLQVKVRQEMEV